MAPPFSSISPAYVLGLFRFYALTALIGGVLFLIGAFALRAPIYFMGGAGALAVGYFLGWLSNRTPERTRSGT